jgi:hypothetical protein
VQLRGLAAQTLGTWSDVNGKSDPLGALIRLRVGSGRCVREKVALIGDALSHSKVRAAFSQKPLPHGNDAECVSFTPLGFMSFQSNLKLARQRPGLWSTARHTTPSYLAAGASLKIRQQVESEIEHDR